MMASYAFYLNLFAGQLDNIQHLAYLFLSYLHCTIEQIMQLPVDKPTLDLRPSLKMFYTSYLRS